MSEGNKTMLGVGTLKSRVKSCLWLLHDIASSSVAGGNTQKTSFVCNVCGTSNRIPHEKLGRESGGCVKCGCYGRLRAMMYGVTSQFSPGEPILAAMDPRKDIRGIGCSDWGYMDARTGITRGYADLLAKKFDYVNTFYDQDPQLDLCNVDWSRWPSDSIDFITCTDVLEHVEPPVDRAFENMRRLLKPSGVVILTVPCTTRSANEHFPNLHSWRIETDGEKRTLINQRRDGVVERYDNLCFHGGVGSTLEFRVFSRQSIINCVEQAGLNIVKIIDESIEPYAIPLQNNNFVLIAERPRD
jgi:SAM-dependent methyltransferase